MKKTFFLLIFFSLVWLAFTHQAIAQDYTEALRYSAPGLGVGARALGLGTAYTGVANDFSAAFWNPAGLGQIQLNEVTVGLSNISYNNTSSFFNNSQSLTNSSTSLNSIGLVYPFPTMRGSLVFAVGYGRQADYTTALSYKGFNPQSSIIQYWAPNGQKLTPDITIAEYLQLAFADTFTHKFVSPINGNLTQAGRALEGGGQNYVTLSGAIEASRNFFIGATLNFITGSYSYVNRYLEEDLTNQYTANTFVPYNNGQDTGYFDLKYLTLDQTLETDISGFSAKLGILYKWGSGSRLGITVKTPSWITVRETFSQNATSNFDNGDQITYSSSSGYPDKNEYDVHTPYSFSAGISHTIGDLMVAGDVEYTDWTQMEFSNADASLMSYNTDIKELFQPTANVRLGAEYSFGDEGLKLRGGFAYLPSPYNGDPSSFAQKYATAGIGFIVDNAIAIDLGYAYGFWDQYHQVYPGVYTSTENVHTHNIMSTVSYRF